MKTAGEESPPAFQGAQHPSPMCPCHAGHSPAITHSVHFSPFFNCQKPTLWGFSDLLPVFPAERAPSSFPHLPWIRGRGSSSAGRGLTHSLPPARGRCESGGTFRQGGGLLGACVCVYIRSAVRCLVYPNFPNLLASGDWGKHPIPPAVTKAESLSQQIPSQISPRQGWAAKRGGMRILPRDISGSAGFEAQRQKDAGVPADKAPGPGQEELIWEPSFLPGLSKDKSSQLCVPGFLHLQGTSPWDVAEGKGPGFGGVRQNEVWIPLHP